MTCGMVLVTVLHQLTQYCSLFLLLVLSDHCQPVGMLYKCSPEGLNHRQLALMCWGKYAHNTFAAPGFHTYCMPHLNWNSQDDYEGILEIICCVK